MGRQLGNHRGIRGSAALATQPCEPGAVPAEALEPGEMRRLPFAGELLGAARVRSGFVAVPLDVFDAQPAGMPPAEQAAYLHLIRLSFGEGRNWCRVAKRELQERLRVSERPLLRVLDGLVARGLARPLHRDNRGTLWRVCLPREAAGEPVGDEVLMGRAAAPKPSPPRAPAPEPVLAAAAAARPRPVAQGPLVRALAEACGELDPAGLERAAREVSELLAEGQTPRRIAAGIEAVRRRTRAPAQGSTP
jgi:hypothetical protein